MHCAVFGRVQVPRVPLLLFVGRVQVRCVPLLLFVGRVQVRPRASGLDRRERVRRVFLSYDGLVRVRRAFDFVGRVRVRRAVHFLSRVLMQCFFFLLE